MQSTMQPVGQHGMQGGAGVFQRMEGAVVLAAAVVCYAMVGMDWWVFGVCLLLPDLAALGYLINWRVGNVSYNIAHTLAIPLVIGGIALVTSSELGQQVALIWLAHIGMDRMVGYSFKQGNPFAGRGAH